MPRGNKENLSPPFNQITPEEHRTIAKKGGVASGKARAAKKTFKEQLDILMSLPLKNDNIKARLRELGIEDDEITNQMAMNVVMFQEALKGNTKAFELIRDTKGEKPIEQVQVTETDTTWFLDDKKAK